MSNAMKKKFDEVSSNLTSNEKVQEATQAVSSVMEDIQDFGKNTKEAVSETLGNIQKNMGNYIHKGQDQAMKIEKKVESSIRRYPLRALLVAAGVGLVFGLLKRK